MTGQVSPVLRVSTKSWPRRITAANARRSGGPQALEGSRAPPDGGNKWSDWFTTPAISQPSFRTAIGPIARGWPDASEGAVAHCRATYGEAAALNFASAVGALTTQTTTSRVDSPASSRDFLLPQRPPTT